jgi:2',3'-cyclic-nucleotide 2'-phosphodiesterase (5'-nucleotidase family)
MIKAGRTLTKNLLVLDAGNSLFSLPIINKVNLSTSQKLQNLIGYDSMAPQSMDFNVGTEKVFNLSTDSKKAAAEFILSANMLDNNNYLPLQPYQLYDFNGFIVCVVGLTSPFTSNLNDQENYSFDSNMVFENSQHAINVARQYADYIVVLGSTGSGDVNDIYSSSFICSNLNGIDLFIDGQYSTVKSGSVVNGATIVNTKAQLKEIGVVDILISNTCIKQTKKNGIDSSIYKKQSSNTFCENTFC